MTQRRANIRRPRVDTRTFDDGVVPLGETGSVLLDGRQDRRIHPLELTVDLQPDGDTLARRPTLRKQQRAAEAPYGRLLFPHHLVVAIPEPAHQVATWIAANRQISRLGLVVHGIAPDTVASLH